MMKLGNNIMMIFVALTAVVLSGCHKENKFRIGVSQCSDDDWRKKMNQELVLETLLHDNAEIEIRSADDSNQKQIDDIRYFARNGFDIIITAPNEAEAITPVIDSVMREGIPVIVFDRSVSGNNFTAFQGADNDSIGRQVASYMMASFPRGAEIVEITGNMASTPARDRHAGFISGLKGDSRFRIVATATGLWNYEDAVAAVDSILASGHAPDVIFAHNDRMAIAAADQARKHGISPMILGVDAAPNIGIRGVDRGDITATFVYPTAGYNLIRTALDILEGKPYDKVTMLPPASAVDASNAGILLNQNEVLKEETEKMEKLKSEVDRYWSMHSIQSTFLYVTLSILALLFIVLFLFLRVFWQNRRQQRLLVEQNHELERQRDNEKILNSQLEAATQSKLMFFTNVSHDLRTPLTLIAEPLRQLDMASNLLPQQKSMVHLANKNVHILRRLINQVLDFRKYENNRMELSLTEINLSSLVRDWSDAFSAVARSRHITLSVEIPQPEAVGLAVDVEKLERVFFNLLSNAFKYTPDNGDITVALSQAGEIVKISVKDTGRGISEEDLGNIFDRFFQVDKVHPNGSGIGLSLAKAFVELHDGTLTVESEPGKGSCFTVTLPVRHVSGQTEIVESRISDKDVSAELSPVETPRLPDDARTRTEDSTRPLLLAIDDNSDILMLLSQLLQPDYDIITASNGADGVRMAAKYVPDLVICDVMMPGMDGLEACRRIKNEVSTSHVPVLMLTACSMDEQRVQGYESGADGYVSKPFNSDVLLSRISNLIQNRRRILDLFASDTSTARSSATLSGSPATDDSASRRPAMPAGDIDSEFYNQFLEIFHAEMGNPDVSVDALASRMGLGRSQFYRKIKALTNFSPVELIKNIRLKEARHLLLTTEKSISEIAYSIGFSTPAYFTKCYREAFGETPSDTRTNLVS